MNKEEAWENLKDLAAMRLLHAMPLEQARAKWSELYGEIDLAGMKQRRERSIATFQKLLSTDDEPVHASFYGQTTLNARR